MNTVVNDIGKLFDYLIQRRACLEQVEISPIQIRGIIHPGLTVIVRLNEKLSTTLKKSYDVYRNAANRDRINITSREYKSQLNKAYNEFQNRMTSEIRCASKRNPKKFWNIIRKCSNTQRSKVDDVHMICLNKELKDLTRQIKISLCPTMFLRK